jgi:L-aspartate oxidase
MVAIDLVTGRHATDFSTSGAVHGLYAFNRATDRVETLLARATILATGGAGAPISIRPRRAARPATGSPWRGAPGAACRTWNSCSSTRPACTI